MEESDYVNHEQYMSHGNHMGHSNHMPNMNHMGNHEGHDMSMNDPSMMQDPAVSLNASDIHGQMSHADHTMHSGHNMRAGEHNMHSGHSMGSGGHMMSMSFHGGVTETILFSWWNTSAAGEFIGSFIAIFICAVLYEGLKYYRKHLLWKTYAGLQYCAVAPPDKGISNACSPDDAQVIQPMPHALERNVPKMLSTAHAWQTFLHGVQVLVSYMLMLVFMTYNTWLCAAVVLGSATGYFLFGWRESVVVDFTEHCH